MEEDRILQTLFYSSLSHDPGSQRLNGKKKKIQLNAILTTALKKRKEHVRGPESNTESVSVSVSGTDSFKCEACNYECEKYVTLQKHRNTNHGLIKCEINQKEDRSSLADTATPEPLLRPIPSCEHRDRQLTLVATAARGPQEKFYQLGIRYKRSNKISPLFVREPPPSIHSPTPLLSPLPSSPPTRPALRTAITHQVLSETIGNHKTSREAGRHHKVRLTNLGGHNKDDLPSVY